MASPKGAARGLVGVLGPGSRGSPCLPHSTTLTIPFVSDQEREKVHFSGFVASQAPSFYPDEFFLPVLPSQAVKTGFWVFSKSSKGDVFSNMTTEAFL